MNQEEVLNDIFQYLREHASPEFAGQIRTQVLCDISYDDLELPCNGTSTLAATFDRALCVLNELDSFENRASLSAAFDEVTYFHEMGVNMPGSIEDCGVRYTVSDDGDMRVSLDDLVLEVRDWQI